MLNRRARIREYIEAHLMFEEEEVALADTDDIFEKGFVNSLFAVQLVAFIEAAYAIELEDEDLDIKKLNSVQNIDALVAAKKGEASA